MEPKVSTSISLPEALRSWIEWQARARDTTISGLVRCMIRHAQTQVNAGGTPPEWPEPVVLARELKPKTPRSHDWPSAAKRREASRAKWAAIAAATKSDKL